MLLRDAARFVRGHVGLAQGIQQRGLAVIDVAHHGDHRARAAPDLPGDPPLPLPEGPLPRKLTMAASAPKPRAISIAVGPSRVWLMVAKIPLSSSRLITSLARASSFSESSLMAIPSLMVILRVIGTSSGTTGRGGAMRGEGRAASSEAASRAGPWRAHGRSESSGGHARRLRPGAPRSDAWGAAHPAPRWRRARAARLRQNRDGRVDRLVGTGSPADPAVVRRVPPCVADPGGGGASFHGLAGA